MNLKWLNYFITALVIAGGCYYIVQVSHTGVVSKCVYFFVIMIVYALVGTFIIQQSSGNSFYLSAPTVFYFIFYVMIWIGSAIMFLQPDILSNTLVYKDYLQTALFKYHAGMFLGIVSFSVGVWWCSICMGVNRSSMTRMVYNYTSLQSTNGNVRTLIVVVVTGLVLAYLLGALRYALAGKFAIYEVVKSWSEGILIAGASVRKEIRAGSSRIAGQGYFEQIIYFVMPFFTIAAIGIREKLKSRAWRMAVVLTVIATCIFLMGSMRRQPIVQFLITTFIFLTYYKKIQFNARTMLILAAVFVLPFAVLTIMMGRNDMILNAVVWRLFLSQSQTGSYIFQLFPDIRSFSGGGIYLQNLAKLLPGSTSGFSAELFQMIHGFFGNASHCAFAEAYANFGYAGVVLLGLLLGWFSQYLNLIYLRKSKTIMNCLILAYMTSPILSGLALGGIVSIVTDGLTMVVLVFVIRRACQIMDIQHINRLEGAC